MEEMKLRVGGVLHNSLANGPGARFVVFMAGCMHECEDCHNKHLWDISSGHEMSVSEITKMIDDNLPIIDGITLSGGEPFLQPEAALEVAKHAKSLGLNVWVYTGYTLDQVLDELIGCVGVYGLLGLTDVLVDGRYEKDLHIDTLSYRGSVNQRIIDMEYWRNTKCIQMPF